MDNNKFKKDLEKLLKKNEDSVLASYIAKCLKDYGVQTVEEVAPVDVILQTPDVSVQPQKSNAAPVGNNPTTSGWSNPFGGTSWGA